MPFTLIEVSGGLMLRAGERELGVYHADDPHKPHWHPLRSPAGHCVTLARPHDHLHHKGLMYALRTARCNFMEEGDPGPGAETGRQRHTGFSDLVVQGDQVGFTETLEWQGTSSGTVYFHEIRRQHISYSPAGGLLLRWYATLTSCIAQTLIQSPWSRPNKEGILINYHGLIIRLPRAWCGTGNHGFAADGVPMPAAEAFGARVREATYYGAMDGLDQLTFASVTLRQQQDHRFCLRDAPFAWMTMGPSNGGEVPLQPGQVLEERYEVEIRDGKPF